MLTREIVSRLIFVFFIRRATPDQIERRNSKRQREDDGRQDEEESSYLELGYYGKSYEINCADDAVMRKDKSLMPKTLHGRVERLFRGNGMGMPWINAVEKQHVLELGFMDPDLSDWASESEVRRFRCEKIDVVLYPAQVTLVCKAYRDLLLNVLDRHGRFVDKHLDFDDFAHYLNLTKTMRDKFAFQLRGLPNKEARRRYLAKLPAEIETCMNSAVQYIEKVIRTKKNTVNEQNPRLIKDMGRGKQRVIAKLLIEVFKRADLKETIQHVTGTKPGRR